MRIRTASFRLSGSWSVGIMASRPRVGPDNASCVTSRKSCTPRGRARYAPLRVLMSRDPRGKFIFFSGGSRRGATLFFPLQFRTPSTFYPSDFNYSSLGYLLWRNKRHCYPFYYSKKKSQQEDLNSSPENKQCNAVLHVALPTAQRAADGSKGGLTNIYLGLNHPRWIGCMQMSTRGLWLAVCKWVRTGVRNCSGKNNLAGGGVTEARPL